MSLFVYFGLLYLLQSFYCLATFAASESLNARVRRVEVGFGPTIADFTLGHTRFLLKLVPVVASVNADGLGWGEQAPWRRLAIVIAGPLSLVLFGSLILSLSARVYGMPVALNSSEVAGVSAESPAAKAGVARGDVIVAITDTKVATWTDVRRLVRLAGTNAFDTTLNRNGAVVSATISPSQDPAKSGFLRLFGSRTIAGMEERIERVRHDSLQSLTAGLQTGLELARLHVLVFWQMSTGVVDGAEFDAFRLPSGDSGQWRSRRVGVDWDSAQRTRGEASLWLYASITILFGMFNLLPVPGLNGGRAVIMVVETLRGAPFSAHTQERLRAAGVLMLLIVLARFVYFDNVGR